MYLNVRATSSQSTSSTSSISSSATPAPSATSSQNVGTTSSASASAAATTTVVVDSSNALPKGPIIAGSICGVLVLVILAAMLWFFCRRRRQLDMMGRSTPLVGSDGSNGNEKFAMDQSPDEEAQRNSGGVFAPFGGYHRTPSVDARDSSDRSLDIGTSRNVETDRASDAPIPDPEKDALVAPPAHEHPAYHPMPGQAPEIPVYNQTQLSAHPSSRPGSTRASEPAYNSLPSQDPKRSASATSIKRQPAYSALSSQSPPEPTYNPRQPQRPRAPANGEFQTRIPGWQPIKIDVPRTSPELPALTFSPISLDTDPNNTPGKAFNFPSPTDAPVNFINRFPSPSELGSSASQFRPTPLSESEIAEIGSSMSQYRPTPLSEMIPTPSTTPFRPTAPSLSEDTATSSELPTKTPPMPAMPPIPHLPLTNNQIYRNPSISKIASLPDPATLPSPTPPPLNFKKKSRAELPGVSTTPRKSSIPPKDLPFNYISLPSPQGTEADDSDMHREASSRTTYSIPIGLDPSSKLDGVKKSIKGRGKGKGKSKDRKTDSAVRLTHNHSREWSESDREHVMSWATYTGPNSPLEEQDEFSPMVEQIARVERFEKVDAKKGLKRKGPKTELKAGSVIPELEHLQRPQKEVVKRSSRVMSIISSASAKGRKSSPRSDIVSPLFSPMIPGHTFSPLSPEERQWAGQE